MNVVHNKVIQVKKGNPHNFDIEQNAPNSSSLPLARLLQTRHSLVPPLRDRVTGFSMDFHGERLLSEGKRVVIKVLKGKASWKKRKSVQSSDQLVLTHYGPNPSENLELKLIKPTDRRFHQLNNIRIAERILFAQPSPALNRQSLSMFFQRQTQYKRSIARMPKPARKETTCRQFKQWVE